MKKKAKSTKTNKITKIAKSTKVMKVKKATKTTKSTKAKKATKKELAVKDRKKVTGGINVFDSNKYGRICLPFKISPNLEEEAMKYYMAEGCSRDEARKRDQEFKLKPGKEMLRNN